MGLFAQLDLLLDAFSIGAFFLMSFFSRLFCLEPCLEVVSTPESVTLLFSSSDREMMEDGDLRHAEMGS